MTYRVTIGEAAERELRSIVRWKTENASRRIASRWYAGVIKKISTLRTHPARRPLAAENDRFPIEICELLHGRRRNVFRIVFTIRDDTVSMLFIQHAAQREIEP